MFPDADGSSKIAYHQFCVIYDSTGGEILSVFESITLEGGGSAPDPKEMEARAKMLCGELMQAQLQRSLDDRSIQTILVGPEDFEEPGPKRVDLKSRRLVPAED
jgi:hypothetical protein